MTDDEIRALLEAATPGPWAIEKCKCRYERCDYHGTSNGSFSQGTGYSLSDARLIPAAPSLAAEVLRLRQVVGAMTALANELSWDRKTRPIADRIAAALKGAAE